MQAAVALAYLIFLCLWIYAEILERSKRYSHARNACLSGVLALFITSC